MLHNAGKDFEKETAALAGKCSTCGGSGRINKKLCHVCKGKGSFGRRTPGSGSLGTAANIPSLTADCFWEFPWFKKLILIEAKHGYGDKSKKVKSIRIQRDWFDKHLSNAKDSAGGNIFYPAFAMKFKFTTDNGLSKFILIPFSTMKELIKEMENLYLELIELRSKVQEEDVKKSNRDTTAKGKS